MFNNMKAITGKHIDNKEEYITKEEIAARIKEGLEEVKLYKEGKIKFQSAKDFLDELNNCKQKTN
jgi:hypothetical protein